MTTEERQHLYTATIPVRWGDLDALGHVNSSRYFTYFEQARVQWLTRMEIDWSRINGPVVARQECEYKRPVTYPATLKVMLFADPPGRSSVQTYYEVRTEEDPETVYALGSATIVWVDFSRGQPTSLPGAFRALTE